MKKINIFLILFLTIFASITHISFSSADDVSVKVFKINYRNAEEMEGMVRIFLSPEGGIAVDKRTNSFIVKDYPENIKLISEFLKEHDKKIEQVRKKIRYVDDKTLERIGLSVNWQYRGGNWAVGNVLRPGKGLSIDAIISAEKGKEKIGGEQTLLVMSGSEGKIHVGRSIPYTDWFYMYSRHYGYIVKETRFMDVSTGFVVRPRVAGDVINIEISPQINYSGDRDTGEIIYREVSTTITCRDGETVLIGSSGDKSENMVRNIFSGIQASRGEGNFYMMLTPEIVK
jgi:type II secretory pathway component GspD/PulD (secretin)